MDADKWSTALPDDILVDIFRRLDVTAVIRCASTCRPWRRAIIDNTSCLRPRPDRFLPDLLLGFFKNDLRSGRLLPWQLHYLPAPSTPVPFLPPATGVSVGGRLYSNLLSSRDGLLLLGEDNCTTDSLCLYTSHTGNCKVLSTADFDDNPSIGCMYVLATGYDAVDDYSLSNDGDDMAAWILAVECEGDAKEGTTYQIFSSKSGEWGPVKRSAKFPADVAHVQTSRRSPGGSVVICHGAVSWFVYLFRNAMNGSTRLCMFSMDLRTERTWTTELPDLRIVGNSFVLAVSEDGRLSLVKMMLSSSHQMEVWVLDSGKWTLRRTIDDVQRVIPNCPILVKMQVCGFCPRSGYLFGTGRDDWSSPRLMGTVDSSSSASWFPFEMDWSTYISSHISKMKYYF